MRLLRNPTDRRLIWVARNHPEVVVYDVVDAFTEATALHDLGRYLQARRKNDWANVDTGTEFQPSDEMEVLADGTVERVTHSLDPDEALEHLEVAMKESGRPDLAGGRTRYDRYLPWAANTLGRVHRAAIREARRSLASDAAEFIANMPTPEGQAEMAAVFRTLALAPNLELGHPYVKRIMALLRQGNETAWRQAVEPYYARAAGDYKRAAAAMSTNFAAIVDWAEATGTDLGRVSLYDAIQQAESHAERMAELERQQTDRQVLDAAPVVYAWPDGWTVRELLTDRQLFVEGKLLRHCVKDYQTSDLVVGGGNSRVFSLRGPAGEPVTTMEWLVDERRVPSSGLRGFANKTPDSDELARMLEFRLRCTSFTSPWLDETGRRSWPGDMPEEYAGSFRRPGTGLSVDVYDGVAYRHDEFAADLDRTMAEAAQKAGDAAYEEDLANYPYWSPSYPGDHCEPAEEYAREQASAAATDALAEYDPSRRLRGVVLPDAHLGDLQWTLYFRAPNAELTAASGDEMINWLDKSRWSNTYLGGMPPVELSLGYGHGFHRQVVPLGHVGHIWEHPKIRGTLERGVVQHMDLEPRYQPGAPASESC